MMRRVVGWVVLVPLSIALVVFALANRQAVAVNFNPFSAPADPNMPGFGVPLFLVIFGVLLVGVVLGGIATWFAQGHHRRDERAFRRENERLHRELEVAHRAPANQALLNVDELANR
ncbi:MAG TPA: lipopolysaccharide assembly protein LapA domain-containing protein [Devosia sp.]|nr:lipopolysaccharide assembly protein LapA domain-containing protein [Devosia sp.]